MSVHPGDEPRFSLAELVESSGVSERSIRYYIEHDLVSPAIGRGRNRYYTAEHLRQLAVVTDLRKKKVGLDEIRELVVGMEPTPEAVPDRWERISVHPDLEIHVRLDAPEGVRALARQYLETARDWFGDDEQ